MQNYDPNKCECTSYEQKKIIYFQIHICHAFILREHLRPIDHVHSAAPSLVALLRVFSLLPSLLTMTTLSMSAALFFGFFSLRSHCLPL